MKRLFKHPVFTQTSHYLMQIQRIKTNEPVRTEIMKDLLTVKLTAIAKECQKVSNEVIEKVITEEDPLEPIFLQSIETIVNDYQNEFLSHLKKRFGKYAEDLYRIFYEEAFVKLHEPNIVFLFNFIRTQAFSRHDFILKIETFFTLCLAAYDTSVFDAEQAMRTLNGKFSAILKKIEFANYKASNTEDNFKEEAEELINALKKKLILTTDPVEEMRIKRDIKRIEGII